LRFLCRRSLFLLRRLVRGEKFSHAELLYTLLLRFLCHLSLHVELVHYVAETLVGFGVNFTSSWRHRYSCTTLHHRKGRDNTPRIFRFILGTMAAPP